MPPISATKALAYATHDEMRTLYGVLVAAWIVMLLGQFLSAGPRRSIFSLFGFLLVIVGVLCVIVSVVAIAHKVLADS